MTARKGEDHLHEAMHLDEVVVPREVAHLAEVAHLVEVAHLAEVALVVRLDPDFIRIIAEEVKLCLCFYFWN